MMGFENERAWVCASSLCGVPENAKIQNGNVGEKLVGGGACCQYWFIETFLFIPIFLLACDTLAVQVGWGRLFHIESPLVHAGDWYIFVPKHLWQSLMEGKAVRGV